MISAEDRSELLRIARHSIECSLRGTSFAPGIPSSGSLREPRGAFVTLTRNGRLRGCIGRVSASAPLAEVVSEMAVAAARNDHRFPPVTGEELGELHIEISALTPLRPISNPAEIEVGRHGLLIRKGHFSGLLLPQVAEEEGWDVPTFLDHTCRKAGLPDGAWKEGAEIEVFEAEVGGEE
jgi:AmmeMemoRadiSam system protein A